MTFLKYSSKVMDSFLTAIQFLTTIAIAFVAIDYVKSFTEVLCKKYFHSEEKIDKEFIECIKLLPDRETLDSIKPRIIDGNSTLTKIEQLKREQEKASSAIRNAKSELNQTFSDKCQVCSISSISLYIALSGIMLMLIAPIECKNKIIAHDLAFAVSIMMLIYYSVGWIVGERHKQCWLFDYSNFKHPVISFLVTFIITIAILIILSIGIPSPNFIEDVWWYVLIGNLVLAFFNYMVFPCFIFVKAHKTINNIPNIRKDIKEQCEKIHKDFNDLMVLDDLSKTLSA